MDKTGPRSRWLRLAASARRRPAEATRRRPASSPRPLVLLLPMVAVGLIVAGVLGAAADRGAPTASLTGLAVAGRQPTGEPAASPFVPPALRRPEAAPATRTPTAPATRTPTVPATRTPAVPVTRTPAVPARTAGVSRPFPPRRITTSSPPTVAAPSPVAALAQATTSPPVTRPAPPATPVPAPSSVPTTVASLSPCAAAIAAVESRGLYPAPGFTVTCPGNALGHEGMTCYDVAAICPGAKEIVIADPQPFVVANEFENSRIFLGLPVRCDSLDCGHIAYGY